MIEFKLVIEEGRMGEGEDEEVDKKVVVRVTGGEMEFGVGGT